MVPQIHKPCFVTSFSPSLLFHQAFPSYFSEELLDVASTDDLENEETMRIVKGLKKADALPLHSAHNCFSTFAVFQMTLILFCSFLLFVVLIQECAIDITMYQILPQTKSQIRFVLPVLLETTLC